VPSLVTFQYNAQIPSELQWNVGVQKSLPGQLVADVSYVGNHGYNLLGSFQGGDLQNLNSVDYGTAFLPRYQDPTLGTSAVPGASAYSSNLLRPYPGLSVISQNTTNFYDTYHSIQVRVNRRFTHGVLFGVNYTRQLSFVGNTGLVEQIQHGANGAVSLMSDWGAYQALNKNEGGQPNYFVANAVWAIPGLLGHGGFLHQLTSDWQIAPVVTLATGLPFTPGYSYQVNGANVNITGSPDWAGKVVINNPSTLGGGCSGNTYGEFNASDIAGPTYGSMGMESGRNYLHYCPITQLDLAVVRGIRVFKDERRRLELRGDVWNALNTAQINAMSTTAQFNNPASMTLVNNQYNGTALNPNRLTAATAGFGAATGALPMRNIQLEIRFRF